MGWEAMIGIVFRAGAWLFLFRRGPAPPRGEQAADQGRGAAHGS